MTASTSMSVFHQWLLADPASKNSACAIILHGEDQWTVGRLILDIAEYLNEYDDDGDGRWLPATAELVKKISQDSNHRRLLGMDDTADESPDSQKEFLKTLSSLGRRGHVVFRSPEGPNEGLALGRAFHAGIGNAQGTIEHCHLILNPELMHHKAMAHIIGDVFLEWLLWETRKSLPSSEIE